MRTRRLLLPVLVLGTITSLAQTHAIDPEHSQITVRVYKSGLFSTFAHDHEIRAPIVAGSISEAPSPAVEFRVATAKMVVLDPKLDQEKRAEVQSTMLGPKVLDAQRYPEIRFRSLGAEAKQPGRWLVEGELSIRGQTRPVQVVAEEGNDGRYRGTVKIKQKDYGIQPVSLAGGTIKVKDEILVEFDIIREMESRAAGASPASH